MQSETSLEIYNDVVNKFKSGISLREIERTTEISRSAARKIAIKENLLFIPDTLIYEQGYELWKQGNSITVISSKLAISRQWLGLYIKQKGETINNSSVKFIYNENIFKVIDNEEKAYWLGFISADGCINERKSDSGKVKSMCLEIGLAIKDVVHLEKFCVFMGIDKSHIKFKTSYLKATDKTYQVCRVAIFNTNICNDLINLGVTPRKSETHKFCKQIPKELIFDYLRGYVDGDGYFRKASKNTLELEIIASIPFIDDLLYTFNIEKYRIGKKSKSGEVIQISINSKDSKRLIENMYLNPNVYLNRKYHKAIAVLERNF